MEGREFQQTGFTQTPPDYIIDLLNARDIKHLKKVVHKLHPADCADLIQKLSKPQRKEFFSLMKNDLSAEVLAELDQPVLEAVLPYFSTEDLIRTVKRLESDDAASVLDDIAPQQQIEILAGIHKRERLRIKDVLQFEKKSAGRLMQSEMVILNQGLTVKEAFSALQNFSPMPERFWEIYLVDEKEKYIGAVELHSLIQSKDPKATLSELKVPYTFYIPPEMDQEDVAYMFKQYGLASAPVVDKNHVILGMITVDDIVHVIDEEAAEDTLRLGGVAQDYFQAGAFQTSLMRLRWLFVTFINTLLASSVLHHFEGVIERYVALAVLMPIVAAMGGNAGMQVVTVVVRALATRELEISSGRFFRSLQKTLRREIFVGIGNGIVFGGVLSLLTAWFYGDAQLGVILGASMLFNVVWAGVAGTLLPSAIHKCGFDPAISSGPFLTTTTDVLGFSVFLGLAKFFLV